MASKASGTSLQKLKISTSALLSFVDSSVSTRGNGLPSLSVVTNEVVLDLYHFMCGHSECTYKTLTQWLSCLFGKKWPSDNSPSIKAITQSIKRLLARLDKLKKLPTSADKQEKIDSLLSETYSLPVLVAKRVVRGVSSEEDVSVDSSDSVSQKPVKVTSEQSVSDSMIVLREKMYAIKRNTSKKLGRRDKAISEQAEQINTQKQELDKLQRRFRQMESHFQLIKKDKERIRHRAVYWRTKTNETRSSSEDREVELILGKDKEIGGLRQAVQDIEDDNTELQDKLSELSSAEEIVRTFHKGRFIDDVRVCCLELLSLNVGIRNVEPVIRSVFKNLVH